MSLNTPTPWKVTSASSELDVVSNRLFDELTLGEHASLERSLTPNDLELWSVMAGEVRSPVAEEASRADAINAGVIGHGVLGSTLVAALISTQLPGAGTRLLRQELTYVAPVKLGDALTVTVTVVSKDEARCAVVLDCLGLNQRGEEVLKGQVVVKAPTERIERRRATLPQVRMTMGGTKGTRLMDFVQSLERIRVGVVHPCDALSLSGAVDAAAAGLIEPVLIGPRARIEAVAKEAGLELSGVHIEDVPHSHAAAARGAELARLGGVDALMKGSLHTDELMGAIVSSAAGLRTKRRITHCFLMQSPAYPRPFIITDAAINIAPDLNGKADIVRNAIDLAHAIGVAVPRVAILAAVETVTPSMQATLDAAALCKMADRGQISGAVLDGPLAFDNAISAMAAHIKGIVSEVAGQADVLVVPDLESGNMLAKQLEYLGGASSAGIVLGARVPIVLTSRADKLEARIASCALAVLLAHRYRLTPP